MPVGKTTKRYSIYLNFEYAELIENMAREHGVTFNGMINLLIRQAIDSKKNMDTMTNFMNKVIELADSGMLNFTE